MSGHNEQDLLSSLAPDRIQIHSNRRTNISNRDSDSGTRDARFLHMDLARWSNERERDTVLFSWATMNELIQVFRDYFDTHLEQMAFVDAGKALKNMVVLLNDASELEASRVEIKEKAGQLEIRVPLMDFEEVEKVSAILLYVKRRIASLDTEHTYGSGLSREPTAEETARILALRSPNGNRLGSLAGPGEESDSFINDLRDDSTDD